MKRLLALFIVLVCVNGVAFSQKKSVGQVKTVVIDAGHGGEKPGAVGKKSKEKDLTLQMALKLGRLIEDNFEDVKVIYTRKKDVDIDLSERAKIANKAKADLFISIHCNSWSNGTPTGVETYVMGLSQSRANMEVAKKENADILLEEGYKDNADYRGFDPNSPESYVMFAMYQNAYLDKSLDFAQNIQDQYKKAIKTIDRGVKQAEIFVLYKTAMPAVLTEVGFISNAEEEAYMMSEEGQATIVTCIFNAFVEYKCATEGLKRPTNLKNDLKKDTKGKKTEKKEEPIVQNATDKGVQEAEKKKEELPNSAALVLSDAETGVEAPEQKEEPVTQTENRVESTKEPVQEEGATTAPSTVKEKAAVVFKVQFMSSGKELKEGAREFKGITDHEYYLQNGVYRYTTGRFATVREAVEKQKEVRAKGFTDAFVVAFYNGERITLQKAKELLEQ